MMSSSKVIQLFQISLIVISSFSLVFAQWFEEPVKVGSAGLGMEHGFAAKGSHIEACLELKYLGGITAGFSQDYDLFSCRLANLVRDRKYVSGVKISIGDVQYHDKSESWLKTGEDIFLSMEEVTFRKLSLGILWGYEFNPMDRINPYITAELNGGTVIYDITPGDTASGLRSDFIMTLPLTAGMDIVFYEKVQPDEKGIIDRWAISPFFKLEIPIVDPGYDILNYGQTYTQQISEEKYSDWWGLYSIGASLTIQFMVHPCEVHHTDSDNDGIPDKYDDCPNTPRNVVVDDRGCPVTDSRGRAKLDIISELEERGKVDLYIYFDYDSSAIPIEAYADLNNLGEALVDEHRDWVLEIAGHTDSIASASYNQKLSERRAKSVRTYLLMNFDIDSERLIAKGYGESQPKADNGTEEGRALNRRVEFIIIERDSKKGELK